jgi:hypothetical protein
VLAPCVTALQVLHRARMRATQQNIEAFSQPVDFMLMSLLLLGLALLSTAQEAHAGRRSFVLRRLT